MTSSLSFKFSPLILLLAAYVSAAQLPYNPTSIFLSPQNSHLVYVLQPLGSSSAQFQLSSLDLKSQLTATSLPFSTLCPTLPFLENGNSTAFTAVIDSDANITVYTGTCSSDNPGSEIWRLSPDTMAEGGRGNWTQETLAQPPGTSTGGMTSANFLAAGVAFSSNVSADSGDMDFYFFGGMCPWSNTTAETWTTAAQYTNNLLAIMPEAGSDSTTTYTLDIVSSRSPPIAQAGHSLTALQPTYSNRSDGTQTQQQDFLLIGGHTQDAFLNMSQIALFSLPQEAWTFFSVDQPINNGKSDLTARQSASKVDSRSGHSAVLTSDGKSVIIFGGWVGDVGTPANPQLAILSVGEGYGGGGSWTWNIPSPTSTGLAPGTGLYGHGAVMLPGDVMLVFGGYTIPSPSSKFRFRSVVTNSDALNSRAYFYNVTSNTWLTEYTAPAVDGSNGMTLESKGPISTTAQKAGLGTGLAIGIIAAIVLFIFYFWYTRRLGRKHEAREKEIRDLSLAVHRFESDEWGVGGFDGGGGSFTAVSLYGDRQHAADQTQPSFSDAGYQPVSQGWRQANAQDAQRTGLHVEIPSPTRGLRRSVSGGRGPYPYERRKSLIHPIAEGNEEESVAEMTEKQEDREVRTSLLSKAESDPFTDGKRDSNASPESPTRKEWQNTEEGCQGESEEWQNEWRRAEQLLLSVPEMTETQVIEELGRTSPTKSDRTISSLSESSSRSNTSYRSSGGVLGIARVLSIRSANLLSTFYNPALAPDSESPEVNDATEPSNTNSANIAPNRRRATRGRSQTTSTVSTSPTRSILTTGCSRPGTAISNKADDEDSDSFTAAKSSFAELQAQGEALLGSHHPQAGASTSSAISTFQRHRHTYEHPASEPTSPTKETKRVGWVDTVRRAFSGSGRGRGGPPATQHRHQDSPSPAAPLTHQRHGSNVSGTPPSRSVSDAGLWRSKRGARDWDYPDPDDLMTGFPRYRDQEGEGGDGGVEDWDVERAAENRVVQVTFTVPRGELRVVNTDVERASLVSSEERKEGGDKEVG